MKRTLLALAVGAALLTGCDSPQRTIDSLRKDITEFKATSDEKTQAKIDESFAKLEGQVAVLQQGGDPKAEAFKSQLASLRADYQAARMTKAVQDARKAIQGFGDALKETAKGVEDAFKKSDPDDQ
jgi:outer membrane murein-binding lipoprotein Lpp